MAGQGRVGMDQMDLELGPAAAAVVMAGTSSHGQGGAYSALPAGLPADIAEAAAIADAEEQESLAAAKASAEKEAGDAAGGNAPSG